MLLRACARGRCLWTPGKKIFIHLHRFLKDFLESSSAGPSLVCPLDALGSAEIDEPRMERGDMGIMVVDYGCLCLFSLHFKDYCSPHFPHDRDLWFMAANCKCLHLRQRSRLPFTSSEAEQAPKPHSPIRKPQVEPEPPAWHFAHCSGLLVTPGAVPMPGSWTCWYLVPVSALPRLLQETGGWFEPGWIFAGDNQQGCRKANECP